MLLKAILSGDSEFMHNVFLEAKKQHEKKSNVSLLANLFKINMAFTIVCYFRSQTGER